MSNNPVSDNMIISKQFVTTDGRCNETEWNDYVFYSCEPQMW